MAGWNGSGTFSRAYDWTDEAAAGNVISSSKFDTENDAFAAGINNCIAKDGQNAATADLPMGGNKHTGVGNGTARTQYPSIGQIQDGGVVWGGTSGGSANAQTISLSPAITAYAAGQTFAFIAGFTNTDTCTLNVNSVGAITLKRNGQALGGGEVMAGQVVVVAYDGSSFAMLNPSDQLAPSAKAYLNTGGVALASAALTGVEMDSVSYEYPADMWDAGDAQFIVVPIRGVYHITGQVYITGATPLTSDEVRLIITGYRGATPFVVAECLETSVSGTTIKWNLSANYKASAGDKFGLIVYQASGGAWTIENGEGQTFIAVDFIRGY